MSLPRRRWKNIGLDQVPRAESYVLDESVLLALDATVEKPVKVDTNTLNVARGLFAHICVEIDLTKPVVGKLCIHDDWYKVQYESRHIICGACGCYGHYT